MLLAVEEAPADHVLQVVGLLVDLVQIELDHCDLVVRVTTQRWDQQVPEHDVAVDEPLHHRDAVAVSDRVAGHQCADDGFV